MQLDQRYPVYKVYREGIKKTNTKPYIRINFNDAIRQPDGQMFEYSVSFFKPMTLLQFKQERKLNEEQLSES